MKISRETSERLCVNCLPIPNPVAKGKEVDLTYIQNNGEIIFLFPDIDFHFFLIFAQEEYIFEEKKKEKIRYRKLATSLS